MEARSSLKRASAESSLADHVFEPSNVIENPPVQTASDGISRRPSSVLGKAQFQLDKTQIQLDFADRLCIISRDRFA